MNCTVSGEAFSTTTDPAPSIDSRRIALLDRVFPMEKLMLLARGIVALGGWMVRYPGAAAWVTVRFTATLLAEMGMPHAPTSPNVRPDWAARAGPPRGPAGFRVSTARQGINGKNCSPI